VRRGWAGMVGVAATVAVLGGDQFVTGPAGPVTAHRPGWTASASDGAPVAEPVRLRIPAIGVDSPIVHIGLDEAGALVPPATADLVGWFTGGPAPGDTGPALLAAHVDSHTGPGVFYRLGNLRTGDRISVQRADGSGVAFTVVSTARVAKTAFPTDAVYAPLPVPMLRLVTCGGSFDRAARSYRDDVIVEAAPA
jgi:hypothetical protein